MDELTAVAKVADRLVGGMMQHQDQANAMLFLGLHGFAGIHERGFRDDSKSLRKVYRRCIETYGRIPHQGDQRRGTTLDKLMPYESSELSAGDRYRSVVALLGEWAEWERVTAETFESASELLTGRMWRLVDRLQRGAEEEHVEARRLLAEVGACDMQHVYEMQ